MFTKTHGDSTHKLYNVWYNMNARCSNKNTYEYKNYGERGIKVCNEWKGDYLLFKKWALSNGYNEGLTLDRINNDGNYRPDNCRFVTRAENNKNKRYGAPFSQIGKDKDIKPADKTLSKPKRYGLENLLPRWAIP